MSNYLSDLSRDYALSRRAKYRIGLGAAAAGLAGLGAAGYFLGPKVGVNFVKSGVDSLAKPYIKAREATKAAKEAGGSIMKAHSARALASADALSTVAGLGIAGWGLKKFGDVLGDKDYKDKFNSYSHITGYKVK